MLQVTLSKKTSFEMLAVKFKNPKQGSGWTPVPPVPAVKSLFSDLFLLWSELSLPMAGAWHEKISDVPSYPNQSGILGWKYQLEKGNICWAVERWGFGSIFQLQHHWGVVLLLTGSTGAHRVKYG